MTFDEIRDRVGRPALHEHRGLRRAARRPRRAVGPRADRRRGRRGRRHAAWHVRRRRRQPGRRPARARLRRARAGGVRRRARGRTDRHRPAGRPVRARPSRRRADRRLHASSRTSSTRSARPACSARPARAGLLDLRTHDPRDHTTDVHRTVDDSPFGGGAGMLMRPEPIFAAVEAADPPRPLFLLGPGGRRFDQALAHELAAGDGFSLLCGRYEGVDHRDPRAPRRRRAERRRRRAGRRRGRRLPRRRGRHPARCPA